MIPESGIINPTVNREVLQGKFRKTETIFKLLSSITEKSQECVYKYKNIQHSINIHNVKRVKKLYERHANKANDTKWGKN